MCQHKIMYLLDFYNHNRLVFPSPIFSRRKAASDLKHIKGPVRAHLEDWRAFRLSDTLKEHQELILSKHLNTVSGGYNWDGEGLHVWLRWQENAVSPGTWCVYAIFVRQTWAHLTELTAQTSENSLSWSILGNPDSNNIPELLWAHQLGCELTSDQANPCQSEKTHADTPLTKGIKPFSISALLLLEGVWDLPHHTHVSKPLFKQTVAIVPRHTAFCGLPLSALGNVQPQSAFPSNT